MEKATDFVPHLNVGVVPLLGIFEVQKNHSTGEITVTGGVEEAFLNMLSEYVGFTYSIKVPDDLGWGTLKSDGSWTGLIGMVQRGEIDMAISKVGVDDKRLSVVDFSYPYMSKGMNFAKGLPGELSTATAFVRPFSPNLWLSFFVYLLFMPFAFKFLLKSKNSLTTLALKVFGTFFNQSTGMKSYLLRERILALSFYLATFFITSSYVSNLLSFLTLPLTKDDIRNIEQLSTAVKDGKIQCTTIKGTFIKSILIKSNNEMIRLIGESMDDEILIRPVKESFVDFIRKKKGVVIASEDDIKILIDGVFISQERFFSVLCGIVIRKRFQWRDRLDTVIHRIWSAGIYAKSGEKYMPRSKPPSENNSGAKRLKIGDLFGIFLLLFCGWFMSVVVFIFELISYSIKRKRGTVL